MAMARGTCPVCGRDAALRRGGLLREHRPFNVERDSSRETGLGGVSRPSGVCRGSGMVDPRSAPSLNHIELTATKGAP